MPVQNVNVKMSETDLCMQIQKYLHQEFQEGSQALKHSRSTVLQ